jgi:hypothetical protein
MEYLEVSGERDPAPNVTQATAHCKTVLSAASSLLRRCFTFSP